MAEQPKSDRTSVTISKRVHRHLKIAAASSGITQKEIVEAAIQEYMIRRPTLVGFLREKEE